MNEVKVMKITDDGLYSYSLGDRKWYEVCGSTEKMAKEALKFITSLTVRRNYPEEETIVSSFSEFHAWATLEEDGELLVHVLVGSGPNDLPEEVWKEALKPIGKRSER